MSQTAARPHPAFGPTATAHDVEVLDSWVHHVESVPDDPARRRPIVLLHGNPTSSFLWRHVFARLDGQGRLLAVDLIGFGHSGRPEIDYSLADHQRYLDAWFDALDLHEVTLVLQDYGATFGLHWAARHPDRVAGILLAEPVVHAIESPALPEAFIATRDLIRTPDEGERFVLDDNRFLTEFFPSAFLHPLAPDDLAHYLAAFPTPRSRRPVLVFPRALPVDGDPATTVEYLQPVADFLATTDIPATLVTFEPGFLLTPQVLAWLRDTIHDLEVIAGGPGVHYVQEDAPQAIAEATRTLLTRRQADRSR